jgi:hypothetical protein
MKVSAKAKIKKGLNSIHLINYEFYPYKYFGQSEKFTYMWFTYMWIGITSKFLLGRVLAISGKM